MSFRFPDTPLTPSLPDLPVTPSHSWDFLGLVAVALITLQATMALFYKISFSHFEKKMINMNLVFYLIFVVGVLGLTLDLLVYFAQAFKILHCVCS